MLSPKSEKSAGRMKETDRELAVSDDSGFFTASLFTEGDGSHVSGNLMNTSYSKGHESPGQESLTGRHRSKSGLSLPPASPATPTRKLNQSYLKSIFDNFNELYHDKMNWIDENIPDFSSQAHITAKKNVLEHWVKDVIEQNTILVQTVEELETEAEKKVMAMQLKIEEAATDAAEQMETLKKFQEQIHELMKEKQLVEKQEEYYRKESQYMDTERKRAIERLNALENDNSCLITLISRIRDMGVWDVNGISLSTRTYDYIFGLYPHLAGSEVQTAFTLEKAKNLEKAEGSVVQLTAKIKELDATKEEAERLLSERARVTEELQKDIRELQVRIRQYEEEHAEFRKSLQETQQQLDVANSQILAQRVEPEIPKDSEMKEMLQELRDLKTQLSIAHNDRQEAMQESHALKRELHGRTSQIEEMNTLLNQLQSDQISTRNVVEGVQEKQDELSLLKDQVNYYQTSYRNTSELLEAKTEVIAKLQSQMDQLNDKVCKWEKSRSCSPKPVSSSRLNSHQSRARKMDGKSLDLPKKRHFTQHRPFWNESTRSKKSSFLIHSGKLGAEASKTRLDTKSSPRSKPFCPSPPTKDKDLLGGQTQEETHRSGDAIEGIMSSPVNRIIADYLLKTEKMSKLSDDKKSSRRKQSDEPMRLPPIPATKSGSSSPRTTKQNDKLMEDHLPQIAVKEKKGTKACEFETLENLMEVCVKASRELNRRVETEGISSPKFKVITGHTHRRHNHHNQENTLTVQASPAQNSSRVKDEIKVCPSPQRDNGDSKGFGDFKDDTKRPYRKSDSISESESLSDISKFRKIVHYPVPINLSNRDDINPEKILAELPKESHDHLVKKWILSSPSLSKRGHKSHSRSRSPKGHVFARTEKGYGHSGKGYRSNSKH